MDEKENRKILADPDSYLFFFALTITPFIMVFFDNSDFSFGEWLLFGTAFCIPMAFFIDMGCQAIYLIGKFLVRNIKKAFTFAVDKFAYTKPIIKILLCFVYSAILYLLAFLLRYLILYWA